MTHWAPNPNLPTIVSSTHCANLTFSIIKLKQTIKKETKKLHNKKILIPHWMEQVKHVIRFNYCRMVWNRTLLKLKIELHRIWCDYGCKFLSLQLVLHDYLWSNYHTIQKPLHVSQYYIIMQHKLHSFIYIHSLYANDLLKLHAILIERICS